MLFIGFLAFFSLVVRPGLALPLGWQYVWRVVDVVVLASFVFHAFFRLITAPNKAEFLRQNYFEFAVIFVFLTQFLITLLFLRQPDVRRTIQQLGIVSLTKIYIVMAQLFIFLELVAQLGRINSRVASLPLPPPLMFLGSFVVVILAGTLLLSLKGATKTGIRFIDALFTATSATCVTGLIVVPTGTYFTKYGHLVILALIQIGGLGLMTFATFSALILKGEIGIKERVVLGDILNLRVFTKIKSMVVAIIGFTAVLEILGTIGMFVATRQYQNLQDGRILFSIFHAVSAFCNAGFSLWDENMRPFVNNALGSIVTMVLIVLGGVGFVVLADLWQYAKSPLRRKRFPVPHLSLHSKFVLTLTGALIISGAILFYILERGGQLANLSEGYRWLAAFFHSITARTAGFNTLPTPSFAPPTLFLLCVLMFIGASPGSTGGGIKTTTFGSLVALVVSRLRGRERITLFGRTLPTRVAHQAAMVFFLGVAVVAAGTLILLVLEPDKSFMQLLFEEISAFATVGLSTGITPALSDGGKLVLIVTMLLGRIGPLTFLTAIMLRRRAARIKYPEEEIMIG